jgi:hypothetical protein
MPLWVAVLLILVLLPLMVLARYGQAWAAAEVAALIALALPNWLVKPVTWRTGARWPLPYYVFTFTVLLFAFVAMTLGLWLSPWWCLAISLATAILIVAWLWPMQKRYYGLQQRLVPDHPGRG